MMLLYQREGLGSIQVIGLVLAPGVSSSSDVLSRSVENEKMPTGCCLEEVEAGHICHEEDGLGSLG